MPKVIKFMTECAGYPCGAIATIENDVLAQSYIDAHLAELVREIQKPEPARPEATSLGKAKKGK